jgi:murein DD-endopeptidase MepM/ murein hydrolase activator NlpD
MSTIVLAALLAVAPPPPPPQTPQADSAPRPEPIVIPTGDMMRLYTDCDEDRWPYGTDEVFVPKTSAEIVSGVARRRALEGRWRAYFDSAAGDSIRPTAMEEWAWPLAVRGRLLDNFDNPRDNATHGALDVFVPREGVTVRSPVSGVVVAAGDDWVGGWSRRRGLSHEGGGLSRRAGNGLILFDPASGGYFLIAHLQRGVLVRAGEVVRRGQPLGRVGHTGNASRPGAGRHLHIAFKRPGASCGFEGVLVADNPYRNLRSARARWSRR